MTSTAHTLQAGYAGTGRKLHVAYAGGPSNCTGTRWNTRLHSIKAAGDTSEELAANLAAKGVQASQLCQSCAHGVAVALAAATA